MCIIAVQPAFEKISKKTLKRCWEANSHGAGIMYAQNGKVVVSKVMSDFDKLYKLYQDAHKLNTNIVIHFRIATSGGINDYNLHPFKISDDVWFAHNGILNITVPKDSKENDTQIYNNGLLKHLPYRFYENDSIMMLLQHSIGSNNKFVFLNKDGDYYFVNEDKGVWDNGIWFSNTSYKEPRVSYTTYNKYTKTWNQYDDLESDDWDEYYNKRYGVDSYGSVKKEEAIDCDDCSCTIQADKAKFLQEFNAWVCGPCYKWYSKEFEV